MKLMVYCCGGFGREVVDIARRTNEARPRWEQIAFLDDFRDERTQYGADVYRMDDAVSRFGAAGMEVVIANGEPFVRKLLRQKLEGAGIKLATLADGAAVISDSANIGAGFIAFPGCFVSSLATLGSNVVLVAGTLVGHDAIIGDNCVISGHVNIGGECKIGSESYVGMGSQIKDHTNIGSGTIVGMGSVVFKDLPDEVIALGNPCRPMRANTDKKVFT